MLQNKTYWIVGASEGLGRALAIELDRCGANLVLSARSKSRLTELQQVLSHRAKIVPMDVSDASSVASVAESLEKIDGLIFVAALYEPMSALDWEVTTSETIADVNFVGAIRVLGRIVPDFVKRKAGHIVIIGSLSGYRGLPGALAYGASKAGLMHLAEAMRIDLCKTPIKVQLFNLGFIQTRLTAKNRFSMPFIMTPQTTAKAIVSGMSKSKFKLDTPFWFSLVFRLSRLLPQRAYEYLFAKA